MQVMLIAKSIIRLGRHELSRLQPQATPKCLIFSSFFFFTIDFSSDFWYNIF